MLFSERKIKMDYFNIPVTRNSYHISSFIMKNLQDYREILDLFEKALLIKNKMSLVEKTRIIMTRLYRNLSSPTFYYELFLMCNVENIEILEKNEDTLTILVFFQNKNISHYPHGINDNDDRPEETTNNFRFYHTLYDRKKIKYNTFLIPITFDPTANKKENYTNFTNINKDDTYNLNHRIENIDFYEYENEENKNYINRLIGMIEHNVNSNNPQHVYIK